MKNIKSLSLSIATVAMLGFGFGGCSSSSGGNDSTSTGGGSGGSGTSQTIVGGTVDLGSTSTSASIARSLHSRGAANCGNGGSVQLYDIDDIDYKTPLLTTPATLDTTTCEFTIKDTDFKDSANAGTDKQYIVRSIVEDSSGKKIEMAAAKIKDGSDVGAVDPVATMIKEKFSKAIKEVKESMAKLTSFGVTQDAITSAINGIVTDFQKNLDNTVTELKADIAAGKVKVSLDLFATTEDLGKTYSVTELSALKTQREKKTATIDNKLLNSSTADNFAQLDGAAKQAQFKDVNITADSLRAMNEGVATLKYNVIENFVKLGLPVHDGNGNLVVYMPVPEDEKGGLPGTEYKISYTENNGSVSYVGSDWAMRLINPKTDLSRATGKEDWYQSIQYSDTIIPANVINSMLVHIKNKITLAKVGKALDKVTGGDGTTDVFSGTGGLYNVTMADTVDASADAIVGVFKKGIVAQSFDDILWGGIDASIDKTTGKIDVDKLLAQPFMTDGSDTVDNFIDKLIATDEFKYIKADMASSLARGIPATAESGMLQFSKDLQISNTLTVTPLGGLALVALYMETSFGGKTPAFKQVTIDQSPLAWLDNDTKSKLSHMWMLDFGNNAGNGGNGGNTDPNANLSTSERIKKETQSVLDLTGALTGDSSVKAERTFGDMVSNLTEIKNKIEKKQQNGDQSGFEDKFNMQAADFGGAATKDANVSFTLQDFNNNVVDSTSISKVVIAPVMTNTADYNWKTFNDHNVTLSYNSNGNQKWSASGVKSYNPDKLFDENLTESNSGTYKSDMNYDMFVVTSDGTTKWIATFLVFPGNNDLNNPFFYDSSMSFGAAPAVGQDASMPPMGGAFVEHNYIEESTDIFFPQIVKTNGEMVGENILSYDKTNKKLTAKLDNGVVNGASMQMTVLFKNYDDDGSNPTIVSGTTGITLATTNGGIKDGAMIALKLTGGSEIQDQTINLNIIYLGDKGELEYELVSENSGSATGGGNDLQSIMDRLQFEGANGIVMKMLNADGSESTTTIQASDITYADGAFTYNSMTFNYISDDFDSITMADTNNNIVRFEFIKDSFSITHKITSDEISDKELFVEDDFMHTKIIFDTNGSVRSKEMDNFSASPRDGFLNGGTWSITADGTIAIEHNDPAGSGTVTNQIIMVDGNATTKGSKVVLGTTQSSNGKITVIPFTPKAKISYKGSARDDNTSFAGISVGESGAGSTDGGNTNPSAGAGGDTNPSAGNPSTGSYNPISIQLSDINNKTFYWAEEKTTGDKEIGKTVFTDRTMASYTGNVESDGNILYTLDGPSFKVDIVEGHLANSNNDSIYFNDHKEGNSIYGAQVKHYGNDYSNRIYFTNEQDLKNLINTTP